MMFCLQADLGAEELGESGTPSYLQEPDLDLPVAPKTEDRQQSEQDLGLPALRN